MKERIDWELQKENQEKKVIARSARNKVTHTGCKLPSDFMTKKEKMTMNGEVMTMEMNKPVKYQAFKLWPADLQREYLENLVKIFGVGINNVAEMMGCSRVSFGQFMQSRNLRNAFPKRNSPTKFDKNGWKLFCDGVPYPFETKTEETTAQNAPESHENALEATNSVEEGTDTKEEFVAVKSPIEAEKAVIDSLNERVNKQLSEPVSVEKCCCDKIQLASMYFSIKDLKSWDDIFELIRKYPLPEHNMLTIELSERTWN